jgi:hypothetical protein
MSVLGMTLRVDDKKEYSRSESLHTFILLAEYSSCKGKKRESTEQNLPYDVAAAVVDGLGDEPHQPDAAAAVHEVDAARHLPTHNYCKYPQLRD